MLGGADAGMSIGELTGLGAGACLAMLVFVLLLAEGLAWAWAKGILTWA